MTLSLTRGCGSLVVLLLGVVLFGPGAASGQETGPRFELPIETPPGRSVPGELDLRQPDPMQTVPGFPPPSAGGFPRFSGELEFPEDPRAAAPFPGMFPGPMPGADAPAPPDCWLISTRHCGGEGAVHCAGEFFRRDHQGRLVPSSRAEFLGTLQPEVPVCIAVHGSFIDWPAALRDEATTCHWLRRCRQGRPLRIAFFTWPSAEHLTYVLPLDVAQLGRRASAQSILIGGLVSQMPADTPVSLLGHSHGARAVVSTMHLLAGGEVHGQYIYDPAGERRRVRAVLAAAALDHHWMNPGERYERALLLPEGVLNLKNSQDWALAAYPLRKPFGYEALGRTGLQQMDRRAIGPLSAKMAELEVSPLVQYGHLWPEYVRHPELAAAVTPYLFFDGNPQWGAVPAAASRPPIHPTFMSLGPNETRFIPGVNLRAARSVHR